MNIESINRILVCMDLSGHDEVICDYVSRLLNMTNVEMVYFLHVNKSSSGEDKEERTIQDKMSATISKYVALQADVPWKLTVKQGSRSQEIPQTAHELDIDHVVVGRKGFNKSRVALYQKIIRKAPCSIALIPPHMPGQLKNILVPVDFSNNAAMALKQARFLVSNNTDTQVHGLHVYRVNTGYSKTGKTFEEFGEVMKENAKQECESFFKEHALDRPLINMHFLLKERGVHVPKLINQFAADNQVDALVIGSRGRSAISSLILGSIAEGLIASQQALPLIIIKNKSEYMKAWEALLKL